MDKYKLLKKMAEKGYTQKSLAKEMGLCLNSVNRKINGIKPIYLEEAKALCEILDISDPVEKAEIFLDD